MCRIIICLFLVSPFTALADGQKAERVPTQAELAAEVAAMPMPSLERRLKARAAAYQLFASTINRLGFAKAIVDGDSLHGTKYALAQKRR